MWSNMGPRVSISKFINAYLSNQIHLEGEIGQGATTFYAVNKKSYPKCDMSSFDSNHWP